MASCRCNCGYLALIVAILAGVVLGILYALGFVATGCIFWVYLLTGITALLLAPLYTVGTDCGISCQCRYRSLLLIVAIGTVAAAGVGLIVATVASIPIIAIVVGVATLFAVLLLGTLVCLTNCLCER